MEMASRVRKSWGERIKHERGREGLSQEALGVMVGVDQSTISRLETGDYKPLTPELQLRIAVALGLDPESLFTWPPGVRMAAEFELQRSSPSAVAS